ncbi:MAG: DUF5714 domain-containing protein [Caldisericia bacterium]|nr:DUF5714 domain-containing protein [Caldisericia bacterium]
MEVNFYCAICKNNLIEKEGIYKCIYCDKEERGYFICPNGHYICEDCRILNQEDITIKFLNYTKEKDILKNLNLLFKHPSFNIFGKEHHFVLGPVVLTSLKNQGIYDWDTRKNIPLIKRTSFISYGVCGTIGVCGVCMSVGATLSTLLRATYLSDKERQIILEATGECLQELSKSYGPRCCKESIYIGLKILDKYFKKIFNINLYISERLICEFSEENKYCKKERCKFYGGKV